MSREAPGAADALSPKDIILWLLRHWVVLLACTFGGAVLAAGISLLIPRSYQSSAVLRPVIFDTSNVFLQGAGANSGLGGVAGSLLGGTRQADDATVSVAMLSSMDFVRSVIADNHLLPDLYPDQWDAAAGRWKSEPPRLDDVALQNFLGRVAIVPDANGLVEINVRWSSPEQAERIERLFIASADRRRRGQMLSRAEANLNYLEKRLQLEATQEMRATTASLASKQLAQIMLSQGPGDYAFEVVSPPFASHFPVAPARKLITVMGALTGLIAALGFLLARQAWNRSP